MPTIAAPDASPADAAKRIALHDCVQVFDDAFSAEFCQQMVASFQTLSRFHNANGRGVRVGHENSAWTELDITPLTDAGFRHTILAVMHQHLARYNHALGQTLAVPATERLSELVIKRYRPQADAEERFQLHFDALGPVANRYLVFLWYLNDVELGGETVFPHLGLRVQPKAGRLLMFPPYWMFQHEGKSPISGEKYIFSTYFLF
jgi:prolyl 4-hydroxylase